MGIIEIRLLYGKSRSTESGPVSILINISCSRVKKRDNTDQVLYQVWRFGCVSLLSEVCQNFSGSEIGEHILSCLPIGSVSYALSTTGGVVAVDSGIPRD